MQVQEKEGEGFKENIDDAASVANAPAPARGWRWRWGTFLRRFDGRDGEECSTTASLRVSLRARCARGEGIVGCCVFFLSFFYLYCRKQDAPAVTMGVDGVPSEGLLSDVDE